MKIAEATHGLTKGTKVQINEGQYILVKTQGFTATFADPNDPRIQFTMPLADKKIDPTGPNNMIQITDELTPAERANPIPEQKVKW